MHFSLNITPRCADPILFTSLLLTSRFHKPTACRYIDCGVHNMKIKSFEKNIFNMTTRHKTKLCGLSPPARSKLNRPNDRCLSSNLVPTFADRGWRVVSVTDPYSSILGFLDRSRYCFFQVAPQLYSQGWVDPVLDPLLIGKSGNAGSRSRASGSAAMNSDHHTTEAV
jgi:hypothetical protein